MEKMREEVLEKLSGGIIGQVTMFTLNTCPDCTMGKRLMDKAGVDYFEVEITENRLLADRYNVRRVPTLIVPAGDGYDKYIDTKEINGFIKTRV